MAETGTIIPSAFYTPLIASTGFSCYTSCAHIIWRWRGDDTGYIIFRNGQEVYRGTIEQFRNAAKMLNEVDWDTNLLHDSHSRLVYADAGLKRFKEYKYNVQAYRETENGTILSRMSNPYTVWTS